jgi:hypothetical protein
VRASLGRVSTPEKHFHGVDTRDVLRSLARSLTPQRRSEVTDLSYEEMDLQTCSTLENLDRLNKKVEVGQQDESEISGLFDTCRDEPVEGEIFPNEGSGYEDEDQSEELGDDDFQTEAIHNSEEGSEYTHEDVLAIDYKHSGGDDSYIAEEGKNYSYINSIGNGDRDDDKEEFEHTNVESYDDHDEGTKLVNSPGPHASPHRPQDLDSIISHERSLTTEEVCRLQERHHELEKELQVLHTEQEQDYLDSENLDGSGPCLKDLKEHAGAVDVAPGVVVVDPEKLDKLLNGEKIEDRAPIFMPDHAPTPKFEPSSCPGSEMDSILSQACSSPERPTNTRLPFLCVKRDSTPIPTTLNPPTVVASPRRKHIEFPNGPNPSTATCFRSHRGKENSPSKKSPNKARRNASLPEEIAEWAREAYVSELDEDEKEKVMEKGGAEGEKDPGKHRVEDPAHLDSIVEHEGTEDVHAASTSTSLSTHSNKDEQKIIWPPRSPEPVLLSSTSEAEIRTYKLDIPGHYDSTFPLELKTNASPSRIAELTRQQGDELDASAEDVDKAARVRLPLISTPDTVTAFTDLYSACSPSPTTPSSLKQRKRKLMMRTRSQSLERLRTSSMERRLYCRRILETPRSSGSSSCFRRLFFGRL